MAATEARIKIAQAAGKRIDKIAKKIMCEWNLSFEEIQNLKKEYEFDLEILSRIENDSVAKPLFQASQRCTADNYGLAWEIFSEVEQNIIALKEIKLW